MLRIIAAVIVGYVVMGLIVFAGLTAYYFALGEENTFLPGLYEPTILWIVGHFVVATLAALAGGYVARLIGRSPTAVKALAVLVFALGVMTAIGQLAMPKDDPGPRTGAVSNMDGMMKSKQPIWVSFVLPFLGVAGALAGGRLIRSGTTHP